VSTPILNVAVSDRDHRPQAGLPADDGVVNAMTVDVEDYFHVSVFDGLVPRVTWNQLESRVIANTEHLLGIFDESHIRATFFVLGWVAERFPSLVARIAQQGHEIASQWLRTPIYDQTPRAFRDDAPFEDAAGSGGRRRGARLPGAKLFSDAAHVKGARRPDRRGLPHDASIFPIRHDRYGIPLVAPPSLCAARTVEADCGGPGSTVQWAR
jgi:hypothetical protein